MTTPSTTGLPVAGYNMFARFMASYDGNINDVSHYFMIYITVTNNAINNIYIGLYWAGTTTEVKWKAIPLE